MNITPKMLSARLKELEKGGLILKRIDAKRYPIKCEYSLTECGRSFIDIVKDMKKWGLKWKVNNKVCENSTCVECKL